MPYVRKTKRTLRRPRRNTRRPKRSVPRSIKSLVSKAITRNQETKMSSTPYAPTTFNSGIVSIGDAITVLPTVLSGTEQNSRIGSTIKPIKLVIRGYVTYVADANAGARFIGGRLFCWSDKQVSNYGFASAGGLNLNLLDVGGNSQQFTGSTINFSMPTNKDQLRFYADKRMKILKPYGLSNTFSPSATTEITAMNTTLYHPFTITIPASKMPATLKYDGSVSSGYPLNFAPYISLGYVDLFGYPADTTVTQLKMEFVSTLYYKDA